MVVKNSVDTCNFSEALVRVNTSFALHGMNPKTKDSLIIWWNRKIIKFERKLSLCSMKKRKQ